MMALVTINNKAEEHEETSTIKSIIHLLEYEEDKEEELFEIDLAAVNSIPPLRYCWDDDDGGRFITTASTSSALLANCLLPIAQLSCAVPMPAKAGDVLWLELSVPERVTGSPSPAAGSGYN